MNIQLATNLLIAVTLAHTFHSMAEPINIRAKVKRLSDYINKKPVKPFPANINTRAKALGIGYGIGIVSFGIFFVIAQLVSPDPTLSILISIGLLIVIEIVNTIAIDKYHVEIEAVTRKFKKD